MGAPSQRTQRTQVIPGTCNPRWNSSMQFFVRNLNEDVLCLTVFDKDYFAPNGNDKIHILKLSWIDKIITSNSQCICIQSIMLIFVDFSSILAISEQF